MSSTTLVQPGTLIEEKWEIIKLIGKGTFSEIYLAENIHQPENDAVAIKIQTIHVESNVLRWEIQVLKALQSFNTVPRFISNGQYEDREYLIMELLTGEVMSNLRNRIRSLMPNGLIPIHIASYLTRQMLIAIRNLHSYGYVHRDIKPSNFVRKQMDSTQFVMIDFGLAKQYLEKDGITFRIRKEKTEFRGTTIYASPFVHDGEDQGPRDDLCSIMHVFIDLICGKLPWIDAAKIKDKVMVGSLKNKYYENLVEFVKWIETEVKTKEGNKSLSSESNFPPSAKEKILEILTILYNMKNDEKPDYDRVEMLLYEAVPVALRHDVGNPNYTYYGFRWHENQSSSVSALSLQNPNQLSKKQGDPRRQLSHLSPFQSSGLVSPAGNDNSALGTEPQQQLSDYLPTAHKNLFLHHNFEIGSNQEDPNFFRIKNLFTRMRALQKKESIALNLITEQEIYSFALRWKNLVKELLLLPEQSVTRELIGLYYQVLVDYQYFYRMGLGNKQDKWNEFVQQQEITAAFLQIYDRVRKEEEELAEAGVWKN